jgi:hypothetical protein
VRVEFSKTRKQRDLLKEKFTHPRALYRLSLSGQIDKQDLVSSRDIEEADLG